MTRCIEVVDGGLLTSVQDATGRNVWRHLGVSQAGVLDPFAARIANRLVGNDDRAALLEVTLVGPTLRLPEAALVGLAGADLSAILNDRPLVPGVSRPGPPGSLLRFGDRRSGARAYLAFDGGIDVPPVLGSPATDLRSGFGGLEGRALRAGDRLPLGVPKPVAMPRFYPAAVDRGPIRLLPGPHVDRFAAGALDSICASVWTVAGEADRSGYRLDGERIAHLPAAEVRSVGLPAGAMQIPPDGRPIIMLADRPVTGGYPVIGVVARADLARVAQLVPGDELRFVLSTVDEARAALAAREAALSVQPDPTADAAWAGSLE